MANTAIVLTGGTGVIGQKILELFSKDYKFIVPTSRECFEGLVKNSNISYECCDYSLLGFSNVMKGCDRVIHAGAVTPKRCKDASQFASNYSTSLFVFEASRALGICNVVNFSSCAVYPEVTSYGAREDSLLEPASIYGVVKKSVESLAEFYNSRYGMNIKSLRIPMVLDTKISIESLNLVSKYHLLARNGERLPVFGNGDGYNNYILSDDVARASMMALENAEARGIYNIASHESISALDAAKTICEVYGCPGNYYQDYNRQASNIRRRIDVTKAQSELGFTASMSFAEMMKYIKENFKLC